MNIKHLMKLTVVLMVCCAIFSCEKDQKQCSIFGVVTDFSTGDPVANANVQLHPSGETTLTGSDGMYEFINVSPDSYSITVSKADYTDLIDDYVIEVTEGKRMRRDVQIKKKPASLQIYDNNSNEITELDFGADWGVTQKTFNIFNGSTQTINYTITKTANWITNISTATGSIDVGTTCPILITIDRGLLADGDNITTLVVSTLQGGSKELKVKAKKSGELPTINIIETTAIDNVTYRFMCDVVSDGGQEVTERGICWNTFGDPTVDDETIKNNSGGSGQFTIRIENLEIGTRYYVRAYAKNAIGIGYSKVIKFMVNDGTITVLGAVFSVEPTTYVYFAPGNLQYQASTKKWRFAEHQYDVIGSSNAYISSTYSGWIDLFGWGTGKNPTNASENSSDYSSFYDWGRNAISNGGNTPGTWHTLTGNEWKYVLDLRNTESGIRYAKACVNHVNGLILLPDDWEESTFNLSHTNEITADFNSNVITASEWTLLEDAGVVFLPAAGRRAGTAVQSVGIYGYYWSSVYYDSDNAVGFGFPTNNPNPLGYITRSRGYSVRLVRNAQ